MYISQYRYKNKTKLCHKGCLVCKVSMRSCNACPEDAPSGVFNVFRISKTAVLIIILDECIVIHINGGVLYLKSVQTIQKQFFKFKKLSVCVYSIHQTYTQVFSEIKKFLLLCLNSIVCLIYQRTTFYSCFTSFPTNEATCFTTLPERSYMLHLP